MSDSHDVLALRNVRTTFQRLNDARFFNGWVKDISPEDILVITCTSGIISAGEQFAFQIFGNKKDAFFRAQATGLQGADPAPIFAASDRMQGNVAPIEIRCSITSELSLREQQGQPRFWVENVTADLCEIGTDDTEVGAVIDIGPGGIAYLSERAYMRGTKVAVKLYAYGQAVTFEGEVRSSVANALNASYRRTGVQIQSMDRVDALRWRQLYGQILEANKMIGATMRAEAANVVRGRRAA